jgi:autotransporter-associated beta strand protein
MFVRNSDRSARRRALLSTVVAIMAAGAAGAAYAANPIDTNQPFYLQSQVGSTVTPDFRGGTLRADQNNVTDANAYTVENFSTNTIDAFGDSTTFSGQFSGAGPLTITDSVGSGMVVVTNGSQVLGSVTIDSGATLSWGDGNVPGGLSGGGGTSLTDNGTLLMNFGANNGIGTCGCFSLTGSGNVVVQSGSWFGGQGAYTGTTTIDAGAFLSNGGSGSISASSNVIVNGTYDISATTAGASITTLSGSGLVDLGAQTLTITNGSTTFSGVIADGGILGGTGGALTIAGGTETLTGANTFTGATTINSGATLQLGNGGTSGTVAGAIVDNGMLNFDYAPGASNTIGGQISGSGSAEIMSGTLVVTTGSQILGSVTIDSGATLSWGDGNVPGGLSGGGGTSLIDNGTLLMNFGANNGIGTCGCFSLTGSGNVIVQSGSWFGGQGAYTGTTTIDAGAFLSNGGSGSISASSNVIVNGTYDISSTTSGASITTLSGAGAVALGSQTLTITQGSTTFSGVIADGGISGGSGGSLTIAGGTETLTGANTFTGATTINNGATLQLGNGGSSGTVAGAIVDNGTLNFDYASGASNTIAGQISGSGSAEIMSGTLVVTTGSQILGSVTIDSGATLSWGDGNVPGGLSGGGGTSLIDNGTLLMNFGANNGIGTCGCFSLTGSGNVIVQSGSWFGGQGAYTGTTTIDAGAFLSTSGFGSISASSNVIVNGTYDISAENAGASITTLSGSGSVKLGNQILTLTNASGTFSGVISDGGILGGTGGALTIASGTETLTGANTFTGATTINSGATLQLGNGGSSGTVAGAIVDNGTLNFNYAAGASNTIAGRISGSGSVEIMSGTLVVTGGGQPLGSVTIDSGATLAWGDGNVPAGLSGGGGTSLIDNGTLVMNFGANNGIGTCGCFSLTGSGNVVVQSGSWFGGQGAYTGTTKIDAGAFLSNLGSGSISASSDVIVNGTYDISNTTSGASITTLSGRGAVTLGGQTLTIINGSTTFSGVIANGRFGGNGSLTIAGGTETLTGTNTFTGATTINPGAKLRLGDGGTTGSVAGGVVDNGVLALDRSDVSIFAGVITGAGKLVQAGTGTTILNGDNTVTGPTVVKAGVLEVGDANHSGAVLDSHLGGVVVRAGGTLAGHGSIVGAVVNAGTVAPGGAVATLTVGSYTQTADGALGIKVSSNSASMLNSLGAVSLAGAVDATFVTSVDQPRVYEIVAGSTVSGTFSTLNLAGPHNGLVVGVRYTANQADLVIAPKDNSLMYGGLSGATLDEAQAFASLVEDRFGGSVCANGAAGKPTEGDDVCHGAGAWGQVFSASSHVGASDDDYASTDRGSGFVGGLDHHWSGGRVLGVAFGYRDNHLSFAGDDPTTDTGQALFGALYGRWAVSGWRLDGQAFYMHNNWSNRREVEGFGIASSSPDGDTEGGLVQATAPQLGLGLSPYARISYAQFNRRAVTETGVGPVGYSLPAASTSSTFGEIGVIWAESNPDAQLTPAVRLGVQQELGPRSHPVDASLAGVSGTAFTEDYERAARAIGVVDASLKVRLGANFDLSAALRGRFGDELTDNAVTVGADFRF